MVVRDCKPASAALRPGPGKRYLPQEGVVKTLNVLPDATHEMPGTHASVSFVKTWDLVLHWAMV